MKNILYYLKRYGTTSLKQFPFNEVDSLLLCQITYLNLESFFTKHQPISLLSLLSEEKAIEELSSKTLSEKKNRKMLQILKTTTRYGGLWIDFFSNRFYVDKVEQFCSMTFLFDDFIYIAYPGTDITLLGWKEDFNMAFLEAVPSQVDAARYLNRVYETYQKPFYVGGHSKGGNLAVYATLHCEKRYLNDLLTVYNHDGPGFNRNLSNDPSFSFIKDMIEKTTCQQARIGILMYYGEKMAFVKSRSVGIFQHDPFNWKVTKNGRFHLVKYPAIFSRIFEKTIRNFLEITSTEERKIFVDLLFDLLMESDQTTVLDMRKKPISYLWGVRKRYRALSTKQKHFMRRVLKKYRSLWRQNTKYYFSFKRKKDEKKFKESIRKEEV